MAAHEPEGTTTYCSGAEREGWKLLSTRRASSSASLVKPELNRGWPQQVWSLGKSTSTPSLLRRRTVLTPTSGKSWSTRQVAKRETFGRAPVVKV